jgi:hypothetical protein
MREASVADARPRRREPITKAACASNARVMRSRATGFAPMTAVRVKMILNGGCLPPAANR